METNKLDTLFKQTFGEEAEHSHNPNWNKHDAWASLQRRRNRKRLTYSAFAAVLIVLLTLSIVFSQRVFQAENETISAQNDFQEYLNRQKLKRLEQRMSGRDDDYNLCFFCGELQFEKKSEPVFQFQIN